jgi:hypothetical protein
MRARPFASPAAAVVVLALLLAACGGTERLTKEQLIAQGDAICKDASTKADPIGNGLGEPSTETLSQWGDALGQLLPIYEDLVGKLKALNPPEADQATWEKITGGLDQVVQSVKAAKDAAASGDLAGFQTAFTAIVKASGESGQLAADYGFQECGDGGGSASASATAAATTGP